MESHCTWGISEMEAIGRTLEKLSTFEKDAARNPEAAEQMSS